MKKSLLLLTGLLIIAGTAAAQTPATGPGSALASPRGLVTPNQLVERRTQYLAKELGLSPDQQARLAPILLAQQQQLQQLREQRTTGGRRQGTAQDLQASQARFDEQIKAALTPQQYARFSQLKNEQRDKLRERRGTRQPQQDERVPAPNAPATARSAWGRGYPVGQTGPRSALAFAAKQSLQPGYPLLLE